MKINRIVRIIPLQHRPFAGVFLLCALLCLSSCELIRMKKEKSERDMARRPVARVNDTYLYLDELEGIVTPNTPKEDSIARLSAYINSWVRKQVLINEALKRIDINEAEVERKILDYRYSLIGYQFQKLYIQQHMSTEVSDAEVEEYYKANLDNFILKQNIIRGAYIKVPQGAPRTNRIKDLIFSNKEKDRNDLKSYCLSFSTAYHLSDSSWIEFDNLVVNSPLAEIPNKIQFLKSYPYYETSDAGYLYYLKIDAYKISDNVSPLEFVKQDIKNIIINKRKVELARKLEEEVYEKAAENKDFEIFNK